MPTPPPAPRPSPTNTRTPRFTPLVIRLACFLLAGAWGLLSGGAYYALHRGSALEATPGANAALLGGAVALLTLFILSFLGGILLSVLDAGELGGAGGRGEGAGCGAAGRAGRSWRAAAAPPARPAPPLNPRTHPALPRSLCVLRAGQGRADREPPRGAPGGLQARACVQGRGARAPAPVPRLLSLPPPLVWPRSPALTHTCDPHCLHALQIYEVFALVPVSGAVVEQPGGEVAYGAEQGQAGAYQPPSVARV